MTPSCWDTHKWFDGYTAAAHNDADDDDNSHADDACGDDDKHAVG